MHVVLPRFTEHRNVRCRENYFSILQSAWDDTALRPRLRPPLLALLGDQDPGLPQQGACLLCCKLAGSVV